MILVCPHCGHSLPDPVRDGVATCISCRKSFISSQRNRLLAASWMLRLYPCGVERLVFETSLPEEEALMVYHLVREHCYSQPMVAAVLDRLGIAE